ncbi:hypothetical protein [Butyrivibrio sp. MC2013]|uniref:hypothetical protein n=1 Tax=Butyrivibrio sp. MC2013 TaxID=1280686 RepID=UPI0012DBE2F7|nr:hypothetical protein [Butyrivibrio sp. MC2013]
MVVAINWNEVAPKWNKIVAAFKKAYSVSSKNISSAFSTSKTQITEQIKTTPSITRSGKNVTINTITYKCTVGANSIVKKKFSSNTYYVAVRYKGSVWVCTSKTLSFSQAKVVQYGNNSYVGIWATKKSGAIKLCQPKPRGPEIHGNGASGYYYHYHLDYNNTKHCHVWFSK